MLHSATAQLFLLLVLMAGVLSDNGATHSTLLNTGRIKIPVPSPQVVLDGRHLSTVMSSINLRDDMRPGHSATLRFESKHGFMAIGMVVDNVGKLNFVCQTQNTREHFKKVTSPASVAVPDYKVNLHHGVNVHFSLYIRNSGEYELRGVLVSNTGRRHNFCQMTLPSITEARLWADLTSSPPLTPKDAGKIVAASFLHPKVANYLLSPPAKAPETLKLRGRPWCNCIPEELLAEQDGRQDITHVWGTDRPHSHAQPQSEPSTCRESPQSLLSVGLGKLPLALSSPSTMDKLRTWFADKTKRPSRHQ
ncbi:hypothetical protein RI367_006357 [Sorochytrium milnesiophthora]